MMRCKKNSRVTVCSMRHVSRKKTKTKEENFEFSKTLIFGFLFWIKGDFGKTQGKVTPTVSFR